MSSNPLISVVIPSYNSGQFVVHAVQSALNQTYSQVEVIVVDDGSTDDIRERLFQQNGRIRYIYQSNSGLSKARNRGIVESHGDLIAFLDADDQWLSEKLEKQWQCLNDNSDVALVHTDLYHVYSPSGPPEYKYRDRKRFSGYCYSEFFWGNAILPSTVLVTRRCLEKVGVFDEQIKGASTQDMDLWVRIARHFPLAYIHEPLVLYLQHANNASRNGRMMAEDELYVLCKILDEDPELANTLGHNRVCYRMSELSFQAGYLNADAGDLKRARRYFKTALNYEPGNMKNWVYWASTFLSSACREKLRLMKQCVKSFRQCVIE